MNSPHKGQWREALMFSLICVWINRWVNNREAGDLRRYHGHYDVNVMCRCRFQNQFLGRSSVSQSPWRNMLLLNSNELILAARQQQWWSSRITISLVIMMTSNALRQSKRRVKYIKLFIMPRMCHHCSDAQMSRCLDCLLSRLFRRRSKKSSKLRVTGFCKGNSPVTG